MATGAAMHRELTPLRYAVDPRLSRFSVRVSADGPLAKLGHNPTISIADYSGDIDCVPGQIEESHFVVRIQARSLVVTDDMNEKDRTEIHARMYKDVLETDKFPEIAYQSTSIVSQPVLEGHYRVQVTGKLSLHGVVRTQQITAQVAFVGDRLRASGDFTLLQSHYNIKLYTVGLGALKVKDELKFIFDIVANKTA
jgi:polyisoprenoid-binding protein YceI